MRIQSHTSSGIVEREANLEDLKKFALIGDKKAQLELAKIEYAKCITIEDRLDVIEKLLRLK